MAFPLFYDVWVYIALCVFGWAALAYALRIYAVPLYGTELCQGYPAWRCKSCPFKMRVPSRWCNGSIESTPRTRYTPTHSTHTTLPTPHPRHTTPLPPAHQS